MHTYLFITYGEPGWRGVQIRALRMASYLPKEEVFFWNGDDGAIIKEWGFDYQDIPLGLIHPDTIEFPESIKVVIFSDIPSNKLFNYSLFMAARKKGLKIVICEQLYRRGQMKEKVYSYYAQQAHLLLLNGLSSFKNEESSNVRLVPPQIESSFSEDTRGEIFHKYSIADGAFLIFGVGYHKKILDKIKELPLKLAVRNSPIFTVISGDIGQKEQRENNLLVLPFDIGDDFFKLIYSSNVVIVKFGFLQILEALALHKPTIVLGEGGYLLQTPRIVDRSIKEVMGFFPDVNQEAVSYIQKLVSDKQFYLGIVEKLHRLHDGQLFGARLAVEEIKRVLTMDRVMKITPKKIAFFVNREIFEKNEILKEEGIYPLCFILPARTETERKERVSKDILEKKIADFIEGQTQEILEHSFKQIFVLSKRKYDGLVDIGNWFEDWVEQLTLLCRGAAKIYISKQTKMLFDPLLEPYKEKINPL